MDRLKKPKEFLKKLRLTDSDYQDSGMINHIADLLERYNTEQLNLCGVMPMLPKITSKEFSDYIKNNGYERIDDELLQKGKNYYCVNNVYRHFLNIVEFGN